MGKKMSDLKKELLNDVEFSSEYMQQEDEFALASQLIEARKRAHLTQEEVARRMSTTQSVVARLESGCPFPSLRSLKRYAQAVNSHLEIRLA